LRLVVAVLTYRRPADLAALLPELLGQLDDLAGSGVNPAAPGILVVDNDPDAGARQQVSALREARIGYRHEPVPGIAAARNRALDESSDADLLVFIDDDERPVDGWLRALVATYLRTRPPGVVGPVVSEYAVRPEEWLLAGGFFERRKLATGAGVSVAATNNLLLDLHPVRAHGLRFDLRFGLLGGSDSLFTRQLTALGPLLVWCAEAGVVDVVPTSRLTRQWVLRRAYRMGNSNSLVELELAGSPAARLLARSRQLLLGASRLGGGAVRFLLGVATGSLARRAAGARNCARGLGLIAGAFGRSYAEYAR
jgi:succinoglycan biosynthesis protein ExoM